MATSDRRRNHRFSLKLPCLAFSPFHTFQEFTGMTENVSRTGMFIRLNGAAPGKRLPGVGSSMCIVVDLPAGTGSSRKYLECEATVVRAEPPQGECQEFGLRVRRMQFRDPDAVSRILSIATGIPESLKLIQ